MRCMIAAGLVLSLVAARTALAIPPPWELETMKAKASLIAICKVEKVEDVAGGAKPQGMAVLSFSGTLTPVTEVMPPLSVLPARVHVLFEKPPAVPGAPGIVAMSAGGTGWPQPAVGETALVFLEKLQLEGDHATWKIICGTWGYIVLATTTAEELTRTVKRIEQYREYAKKISDETLRQRMDEVYRKVVDYVRKPQ